MDSARAIGSHPGGDVASIGRLDGAVSAQSLTQYAVITRYPADLGEVGEQEWPQAIARARAVVEWAQAQVA